MEKFSTMIKTNNRMRKVQTENGEYGKFARPVQNGRLATINTASTKPPNQPITKAGVKVDGRPASGQSTAGPPMPGPPPTRTIGDVNGLSSVKTKIEDKTKNNQMEKFSTMIKTNNRMHKVQTENGEYGKFTRAVRNARLAPINTACTKSSHQPKTTFGIKVNGRLAPGHSVTRPPMPGPPPKRPNRDVNGLSSVETKIEDKTKNNQKNIEPATVTAKSNPLAADEDKSETWLNNDEDVKKCADGNRSVEAEIRDSITVAVLDCLRTSSFTERLTEHVVSGIDAGIKRMTSQALFGTPDHLKSSTDAPMPELGTGVASILSWAMTQIRKEVQKTFQNKSCKLETALSEPCHTVPEILDCIFEPMLDLLVSTVDDPQSNNQGSEIFVTFASQVFDGAFENIKSDRTHLITNQSQVHKPRASAETCTSDGSGDQIHTESLKKIKKEDSIGSPLISMKNASVEKQVSRDAFQKHSSDSEKFSSSCKTSDHSNLKESLTRIKLNLKKVSRGLEFMKTAVAEHVKCISSFEDEAKEGHVAESVLEEFRQNSPSSILRKSKRILPSVSHELRLGDEACTSDGAHERLQTESFNKDSVSSPLICMENAVRICSVEKQEVKSPRLSKSKNNDQLCSNGLNQDRSSGHEIKSTDEDEAASGSISHFKDTLSLRFKSFDSDLGIVPEFMKTAGTETSKCNSSFDDEAKEGHVAKSVSAEFLQNSPSSILKESERIFSSVSHKLRSSDETWTSNVTGERLQTESFNKDNVSSPLICMENAVRICSVEKQEVESPRLSKSKNSKQLCSNGLGQDQSSGHGIKSTDEDKAASGSMSHFEDTLSSGLKSLHSDLGIVPEFMKTAGTETSKCNSSFDDEAKEGHVAKSVSAEFLQNSPSSILKESERIFSSVSHKLRSSDETWTSNVTGERLQTESFNKDSVSSPLICMENAVRICSVEKQEVKSPRLSKSKNNNQLCSNGLDQDQSSGHGIKSTDEDKAASGSMSHFEDTLSSGLKSLHSDLGIVPEFMKTAGTETSKCNSSFDDEAKEGHVAKSVSAEFLQNSPSSILKESERIFSSVSHKLRSSDETWTSNVTGERLQTESFNKDSVSSPLICMENAVRICSVEKQEVERLRLNKSKNNNQLCSNGLDQDQSSVKSTDKDKAASGSMSHFNSDKSLDCFLDNFPDGLGENISTSIVKPPPIPVTHMTPSPPSTLKPVSENGSALRNRCRVKGSSLPDIHVKSQIGAIVKSYP